ncbi:MAG: DUF177 domain-containing protein [Cytophagales bacterium]|nr:DUF177 domain-containing protein [Cytophagales bacterium]
MKELKKYLIELYKLKNELQEFTFEIDHKFFECFEESIIEKGELTVVAKLDKTDSISPLNIMIKGKVELTCDKSLDLFSYPLEIEHKLVLKYGEEFDDSDDTIIIVDRNQPEINIAPYIYEFVTLEIPFRKLHPRYQEEEEAENLLAELGIGSLNEANQLIYSTLVGEEEEEESEKEEIPEKGDQKVDPRWAALQKLKKEKK